MAFQPGGAPRGRGSGRARGAGRGGAQRGSGGGGAPPLAAQMRQLNRLGEPDEMALFRRYRDLEILQIRSTYGPSGLLERQALVPPATLVRGGQQAEEPAWLSILQLDTLRSRLELDRERERALARRAARLPQPRQAASWSELTPEERRVLLLSQKEYNSFRASEAPPRANAGKAPEGTAQVNNGPGQDAGDDADEEAQDEPAAPSPRSGGSTPSKGGPKRR